MSDLWSILLGGALTLVGSFAAKMWDEWRQATALRGAFRAEISGILDVAHVRKHKEVAEQYISAWEAGNNIQFKTFGIEMSSKDPVYNANVGRIGGIGRQLAEEVTAFYAKMIAVRITMLSFDEPIIQNALPADKAALAKRALEIWEDARSQALKLLEKL